MTSYRSSKTRRHLLNVLTASALLMPIALPAAEKAVQAAQFKEVSYEVSDIAFAPGSDETQRTFNWYTAPTDNPGVVQFAKANNGNGKEFPRGKTTTVNAILEEATSGESSYEATITGLKEDTRYNYRFGDGKDNWSETYSFEVGGDDAFNFLLFGDPQVGSSGNIPSDKAGWNDTLDVALAAFPDTDFLISAGDQVNKANNEEEYNAYFSPDELKEYPIQTTIGNHDNSATYDSHFNVPNESVLGATNAGGDYYYTYNDALFIVLNTNSRDNEEHVQFIEETVVANPDAIWKFVVMHHSIYSENSHKYDKDILERREDLVPAFDANDIDVVFAGHDHGYVRTHQMEANQPLMDQGFVSDNIVKDPSGVLYLTSNSSSGSKYYNWKDGAGYYTAVRSQLYKTSFMNAEITDESALFTTYDTETNEVIDQYKIVK